MRNPERIGKMLKVLEEVWMALPDMRLGQLIENAAFEGDIERDVWYVEDDIMIRGLEDLKRLYVHQD